ncbi:MAG: transcriptional regulator [Phenylobacterium sp.]|nr:transcriptional regulator [Phenylobacterium sp.]
MTFAEAATPRVSPQDRFYLPGLSSPASAPGNRPQGQLVSMEAARLNSPGARALLFGRFRLVLHSRELLLQGAPVPIGNRAIDVLLALIDACGELVTKDELLSRVWPNTTVEENNLQFQISTLRKALGADRDFIKTVCGRGYRFVAEITVERRATRPDEASTAIDRSSAQVVQLVDLPPPGALPAARSELVGRDAQLSDVAALVAANRLVTLVGAGGIGKTRLALELARRLLSNFEDGVRIAELGPLSDPELVLPTIAAALELSDAAASPERLAAALGPRRPLLVLDNCEHVIDAVAAITEALLHANPSLQVIATSREPLRAEGEWVYRVPPLDVPPEGAEAAEDVLQHSAAKLFMARTAAAQPVALLDRRLAAAVAKICRRLDGVPLAIELAAASAAALGVEGLASRLDDRLSLLTNGRRTAPTRHQTLRATLDWSYELLSEPERVVMRRLAVFADEFTMEAASAVAASREVTAADVVGCLAALVTKSLVASDVGGPVPHYRLLETMRAYAMERLVESGEVEAVARRHAAIQPDGAERAELSDV